MSKQTVLDDRLATLERDSRKHGSERENIDYSDSLEGEREQGITIDVAYRYFSTASRSFTVADTPGTRAIAAAEARAEVAGNAEIKVFQ